MLRMISLNFDVAFQKLPTHPPVCTMSFGDAFREFTG